MCRAEVCVNSVGWLLVAAVQWQQWNWGRVWATVQFAFFRWCANRRIAACRHSCTGTQSGCHPSCKRGAQDPASWRLTRRWAALEAAFLLWLAQRHKLGPHHSILHAIWQSSKVDAGIWSKTRSSNDVWIIHALIYDIFISFQFYLLMQINNWFNNANLFWGAFYYLFYDILFNTLFKIHLYLSVSSRLYSDIIASIRFLNTAGFKFYFFIYIFYKKHKRKDSWPFKL